MDDMMERAWLWCVFFAAHACCWEAGTWENNTKNSVRTDGPRLPSLVSSAPPVRGRMWVNTKSIMCVERSCIADVPKCRVL